MLGWCGHRAKPHGDTGSTVLDYDAYDSSRVYEIEIFPCIGGEGYIPLSTSLAVCCENASFISHIFMSLE